MLTDDSANAFALHHCAIHYFLITHVVRLRLSWRRTHTDTRLHLRTCVEGFGDCFRFEDGAVVLAGGEGLWKRKAKNFLSLKELGGGGLINDDPPFVGSKMSLAIILLFR